MRKRVRGNEAVGPIVGLYNDVKAVSVEIIKFVRHLVWPRFHLTV